MLQRIRNRDRHDFDETDWSHQTDDPYGARVGQVADEDFVDHFARRAKKKRSVASRVAKTVVLALVLAGLGAATYYVGTGGFMNSLLGGAPASLSPATASETTNDPPPQADTTAALAQLAQSGPAPAPPPPPVTTLPIPSVEGLVILIRNAVVALQQANESGNYSVLREIAAPEFRSANTPADLSDIFTALRERGVDLAEVTVVNPRLRVDPVVDAEGLLRLSGFYPAGAVQVDFDLLFKADEGRWRLFGIGLAPGEEPEDAPAPAADTAGKVPEPARLVTLIRSTVIALNQANLTGNYSVLRDIGAPGFSEANDLVELAAIFNELRRRGLDLSPVAVIDPKLFKDAAIDKDGYLRLTGFFPSRPEQVNFDLAYKLTDDRWRLFGIGLNTSVEVPADAAAAATPQGEAAAGPAQAQADQATAGPVTERPPRLTGPPPTPRLRPLPPPPVQPAPSP